MTNQSWTHDDVAARFRSTWDTLRRLPRVRGPSTASCSWPDTVQDWFAAYGYTEVVIRLPAPKPRAIDEMEETFTWFNHFEGKQEADVVWLSCGCGLKYTRVGRIIGLHRETVRIKMFTGISRIVSALNKVEPKKMLTQSVTSVIERH